MSVLIHRLRQLVRRWPALRIWLRAVAPKVVGGYRAGRGALARRRWRFVLPERLQPRGPAALVRFAGVLDGQTLNLDLRIPQLPAGSVQAAEIHVVQGDVRRTGPARVHPADGGATAVTAAVLLKDSPAASPVTRPRRWRLECVLQTASGERHRLPLRHAPAPRWAGGPTVAAPRAPITGERYVPEVAWSGRTVLRVSPPPPLAEVDRLLLSWTTALVEIRMVGVAPARSMAVEFQGRDGGVVTVTPESCEGDTLRVRLPVAGLAAHAGSGRESTFDVWLVNGSRRFRVGRRLHDLTNPKQVLRIAPAIVWVDEGAALRVRPYYTSAGNLALACIAMESVRREAR
ncbi:MAG TPA: hypothetical protein VNV66_19305 [Pilimelia sp.]|nr:hypothetical protein [Pilimelia sp.]